MRLVVAREHEVDDRGARDAVLGDEQQLTGWRVRRPRRRPAGRWSARRASRRRGARTPAGRCWPAETPPARASLPAHWPRPARPAQRPRAPFTPRRRAPRAGRRLCGSGALRRLVAFVGRQLRAQRGVLRDHVLVRGQLRLRPRHRRHLADRLRVLQVRVDRGDDDARLDGDQVDADQRDADPGIDDDALVQDAVENVDETCPACRSFNCHSLLLLSAPPSRRYRLRRVGAAAVNASTLRSSCRTCACSSSVPSCAAPLARPATGRGRTATSRGRSPAPCPANRRAAGSGW